MNYTFKNSSIVSVNSGTIVLNVSGKTRTFADAKLVSAVDGKIVLDLPKHAKENGSYLVIQINDIAERVFIVNPYRKCCIDYHVSQCSGILKYTNFWVNNSPIRNATPEEIQELNDQLAAEGKRWNPDTMQIEKLRWKPKNGEHYFTVVMAGFNTYISEYVWENDNTDKYVYKIGNYFKTKEEAEAKFEQIKKVLLEN
jgi:hypothetical protein